MDIFSESIKNIKSLDKPIIYLSGPIQKCSDEECFGWRNDLINKLSDIYTLIDPTIRDYRNVPKTPKMCREICEKDKYEIRKSDLIIVNALFSKGSWGTPMEVMYAYMLGIPIITVTNTMNPWLSHHSYKIFDSFDCVVKYLRKLN